MFAASSARRNGVQSHRHGLSDGMRQEGFPATRVWEIQVTRKMNHALGLVLCCNLMQKQFRYTDSLFRWLPCT